MFENEILHFISFHSYLFKQGKAVNYIHIDCFSSCLVQRKKIYPQTFTIKKKVIVVKSSRSAGIKGFLYVLGFFETGFELFEIFC